jgi:hypothetical protein
MPRGQQLTRLLYRANAHRSGVPVPSAMVSKTKTTVSVERVDFQSATHTKKQQAWRYKGNLVARAASATINGRKLVDPKPGANGEAGLPRRKQESNFFLTINPNLAPREGTDVSRVTAAVEKMVELLGTNAGVKSILKFGPKDEHYKTDRFEDVILNVGWKSGVEMGGIQGRVHAHVWATISHISQVQVDVHKLQYLCRHLYNQAYAGTDVSFPATFGRQKRSGADRFLMTRLPYVHVKLLPQANWTEVMKQYIHKGAASA